MTDIEFIKMVNEANVRALEHSPEASEDLKETIEKCIQGFFANLDDVNFTPQVTIYTDGSCLGNPGPGGTGAILTTEWNGKPLTREYQTEHLETTNGRMELLAITDTLDRIHKHFEEETPILVVSDSKYVVNGFNSHLSDWVSNLWIKKGGDPVKHKDLWEKLLNHSAKFDLKVEWTNGHAGDPGNERAHILAKEAAQRAKEKANGNLS